jgi:hypothetical protein
MNFPVRARGSSRGTATSDCANPACSVGDDVTARPKFKGNGGTVRVCNGHANLFPGRDRAAKLRPLDTCQSMAGPRKRGIDQADQHRTWYDRVAGEMPL